MILQLEHYQAGGDCVVSTSAVMSLLLQRPDISLLVKGSVSKDVFLHFPRTKPYQGQPYDLHVRMENPLISSAKFHYHFIHSYHRTLSKALGEEIAVRFPHPVIHVSQQEQGWKGRVEEVTGEPKPYFVITEAGAKPDYTIKRYPRSYLQEVVNQTPDIQWVQVGERHHNHRPLSGVVDQIGKTTMRELIRLIAHPLCRGVLTGESLCWHLAAAFKKPAVCLAASWLAPSWVTYHTGTILHRCGTMSCCQHDACGKTRVVPLGDGKDHEKKFCTLPMVVDGDNVPACMEAIKPAEVVEAIRRYQRGGLA